MQDQAPLDEVTERPVASVASGCIYAVYVVGFSAVMLFLNALVCLYFYPKPDSDDQLAIRLGQLFFFTVPLIMLIVEWHLLDRLRRLFRPNTW